MNRDVQDALLQQLKNPFDVRQVKWRVGATNKEKTKGIALAYIDARDVMKRLDDVCGVAGWQAKYIEVNGGFICELSIKVGNEWITKANAAGHTKVEAIKGGASDALKRAASVWGIGRYLYYLPNKWVLLNKYKQLTEIPELPQWAIPKAVERWEDVAELEADVSSGIDIDYDAPEQTKDDAKARLRGQYETA